MLGCVHLLPLWERRKPVNVIGKHHLQAFTTGSSATVKNDLYTWQHITQASSWLSSADVQKTFSTAVQVNSTGDWEFPIPLCNAVVKALVDYQAGLVVVTKVE